MASNKIAFKTKEVAKKLFRIRFFRYCFAGGIAGITDLAVFFIFNEIIKVHYLLALVISFAIAVGVNYALQRRITFKNTYSKKHKQFFVFIGLQIIGLLLSGLLTTIQVEMFGFWPTFARFMAIWIVLIYNYLSNRFITFNLMK